MMSRLVLLLTIAALLPVKGQQCWVPGTCDSGLVIEASVTVSKETCLEACQLEPECQWFTYFASSSICTLFSGKKFI